MGEATRDGAAVQRALTALISTHYRPTGHDAAGTFRSLAEWVQVPAASELARFCCTLLTFPRLPRQRLELGDALKHLSVVHVAGTKGKARAHALSAARRRRLPALSCRRRRQGSTCAFAESVLRTCGRRTGLFTSPHLVDIRERIQIDGCGVQTNAWCRRASQAATPLTLRDAAMPCLPVYTASFGAAGRR
jgi:hypothetical protein